MAPGAPGAPGDGEGGVSSNAFLGEAAPAAGGKDAHWSPSEYEWDPVAMVRAVLCCGQDLIAVSALMPPPQAAAPLAQRSVGPLQPVLPAGDPSLAVERNFARWRGPRAGAHGHTRLMQVFAAQLLARRFTATSIGGVDIFGSEPALRRAMRALEATHAEACSTYAPCTAASLAWSLLDAAAHTAARAEQAAASTEGDIAAADGKTQDAVAVAGDTVAADFGSAAVPDDDELPLAAQRAAFEAQYVLDARMQILLLACCCPSCCCKT